MASACDASADSLSTPTLKQAVPSSLPQVVETASGRRERMLGELKALSNGFALEIAKIDGLEEEVGSFRNEVQELRRRRDELVNATAGLNATIDRLSGEIRVLDLTVAGAEARVAAADMRAEKWRLEAEQARREAENVTREKIAKAGREIDKMMERYLKPVLVIVGQGAIDADDLQPISVNLENLQQKVKALTDKMGAEPAAPDGARFAASRGSTDEAGN
jgi:chromosome segregation ATPase